MNCYQMPVGYCGGPLANTIYTQILSAVQASAAPVTVKSSVNLTPQGKIQCGTLVSLLQTADAICSCLLQAASAQYGRSPQQ